MVLAKVDNVHCRRVLRDRPIPPGTRSGARSGRRTASARGESRRVLPSTRHGWLLPDSA